MAVNYLSEGKHVTLTATAAIASGQGLLVGSLFGVALESATTGQSFDIGTTGVWNLPSDGSAFTIGETVYWNGTQVTATSGSNTKIGCALQALASGGALISVRLNGTV